MGPPKIVLGFLIDFKLKNINFRLLLHLATWTVSLGLFLSLRLARFWRAEDEISSFTSKLVVPGCKMCDPSHVLARCMRQNVRGVALFHSPTRLYTSKNALFKSPPGAFLARGG